MVNIVLYWVSLDFVYQGLLFTLARLHLMFYGLLLLAADVKEEVDYIAVLHNIGLTLTTVQT